MISEKNLTYEKFKQYSINEMEIDIDSYTDEELHQFHIWFEMINEEIINAKTKNKIITESANDLYKLTDNELDIPVQQLIDNLLNN